MKVVMDAIFNPPFPYKVVDGKNEVELSIGIKDRILFITFLGSVSKMDWVHNFMFWKKPYKDMAKPFFVHAGFLKVYKLVRDEVRQYASVHYSDYDTVVILGHSLGGAVATLCLEDMVYLLEEEFKGTPLNRKKDIQCYTTGAPRVFGVFFNKLPRERCAGLVRCVYGNDGIPTLPPALFGYRHVGRRISSESGLRKKIPLLYPSGIYHHDVSRYREFWIHGRVDNAETNSLYEIATYVYSWIYRGLVGIGVTLLVGLILTFLL